MAFLKCPADFSLGWMAFLKCPCPPLKFLTTCQIAKSLLPRSDLPSPLHPRRDFLLDFLEGGEIFTLQETYTIYLYQGSNPPPLPRPTVPKKHHVRNLKGDGGNQDLLCIPASGRRANRSGGIQNLLHSLAYKSHDNATTGIRPALKGASTRLGERAN